MGMWLVLGKKLGLRYVPSPFLGPWSSSISSQSYPALDNLERAHLRLTASQGVCCINRYLSRCISPCTVSPRKSTPNCTGPGAPAFTRYPVTLPLGLERAAQLTVTIHHGHHISRVWRGLLTTEWLSALPDSHTTAAQGYASCDLEKCQPSRCQICPQAWNPIKQLLSHEQALPRGGRWMGGGVLHLLESV